MSFHTWKNPFDGGDDRLKWRFNISVFRNYIYDTPMQFDRCFEFDWKSTKVNRFVKNLIDLAKLRKLVKKYYKFIKFGYKYYSC